MLILTIFIEIPLYVCHKDLMQGLPISKNFLVMCITQGLVVPLNGAITV